MKKILLAMLALFVTIGINAQGVEIYKNGKLINYYKNTDTEKYMVVFKENPEADLLLPGKFTVNDSGKKVQFTNGNLYWDGSEFRLEEKQTNYPTEWNEIHIGHLSWTNWVNYCLWNERPYDKGYACHSPYNEGLEYWCSEKHPITVQGIKDLFVLSESEWDYLIKKRSKRGVTVDDQANCLIIAPDGYNDELKSSYTIDEVNSLGLLCLPPAGSRSISSFSNCGEYGWYWSSTLEDESYADCLFFSNTETATAVKTKSSQFCVRLVKLAKE